MQGELARPTIDSETEASSAGTGVMEFARRSSEKKSPRGSPRSSICSSNAPTRSARRSVSSYCSSDDTRSIESVATTTSIDSNDDLMIQETKPQYIRTIRRNGKDKTGKFQYAFALESGVVVPFANFHKVNRRTIARLTGLLNGSIHDKREQSNITQEFCSNHFIRLQKNGRTHLLIDLGEAQLSAFRSAW